MAPAPLEAFEAGDQTVAAFLRGLDLFSKGQWSQAATQLQIAAGDRREFFPAAFYLGATFAALGRDRDAAGVWQLALGTETRPAVVYAMVADARLRDGQAQAAIDILKPAYEQRIRPTTTLSRRPGDGLHAGPDSYAAAIPILDATIVRRPTDQEALVACLIAHYELVRGGAGLSTADDAKLRRYVVAYKGPDRALLEKYLQTHASAVTAPAPTGTGATTRGPSTARLRSTGSTSAPTSGARIWACPRGGMRSRATSPRWRGSASPSRAGSCSATAAAASSTTIAACPTDSTRTCFDDLDAALEIARRHRHPRRPS